MKTWLREGARVAHLPLILMALSACAGSPPIRHYLIHDAPLATPASETRSAHVVQVLDLRVARHLDRTALVQRVNPNELETLQGHEWAAPLDEQLLGVLIRRLREQVGPNQVTGPQQFATAADFRLLVEVERFERNEDGFAVIAAQWQIMNAGQGKIDKTHHAELRSARPLGDDQPLTAVAALSELYSQLCDRIAADLAGEKP